MAFDEFKGRLDPGPALDVAVSDDGGVVGLVTEREVHFYVQTDAF